jgi:LmbE family N-acetylglucosaminyl deacetylase
MKNGILTTLVILGMVTIAMGQAGRDYNTADLIQGLQKANTTGSVLYIAAHPDDENTRLISWLANERHVRTGYLSLTRGDGGQNLVGTEKSELMGLLRTQELLAARRIDGGEQFFTRAVDFGYSKNPEETFTFWEKDKILADVVWTIRKFKPDVLITRFPPTSSAGHGHHTASAILAEEAFELAADPKAFPEQLEFVEVWQAKRLFHNTSSWWYKDLPERVVAHPDSFVTVDVGTYNPILGQSYSEIASESRSQHQSQGFGSGKTRGEKTEYLQLVKGENSTDNDMFSGIETTWKRYDRSGKIQINLNHAIKNFQPKHPETNAQHLIEVLNLIEALKNPYLEYKSKEIEDLLLGSLGIWLEAIADDHTYAWGDSIKIETEIVVRSPVEVSLKAVKAPDNSMAVNTEKTEFNKPLTLDLNYIAPNKSSHPYWLDEPFEGIFTVTDQQLRGVPENEPIQIQFDLVIGEKKLSVKRPLVYKWTDPVKAEIYRPVCIVPPVSSTLQSNVYIFANSSPQDVVVAVENHGGPLKGKVLLQAPKGWNISNNSQPFTFSKKGQTNTYTFSVTAPENGTVDELRSLLIIQQKHSPLMIDRSVIRIEYDHVPIQTLIPPAKAKIVRLDVAIKGRKIGYVMGAGDEVPANLAELGFEVTMLDVNTLSTTDFSGFDAILTGIRAYNTEKALANGNKFLLEYASKGGTVIVQYNTNRGLVTEDIGPYPMKLSRDRVTDETAAVEFLNKKHPMMLSPNKLTTSDFDGWVQERGLYFANEWSDQYTALLSWHDKGEDAKNGALLVADYGKGAFVYTGISFFRQLPAGVSGAYRLLANIIAYKPAQP